MRFPILIGSGLLLSVAACATPSVNTPTLSSEEVQRERELQAAAAKGQPQEITVKTRETSYYQEQLKRIAPRIQKAGIEACEAMRYSQCEFGFKLAENATVNAFADGKDVTIFTGMMAFAGNDDAVAAVLAHEYAHNMLKHVANTQRNVAIGSIGGALVQQVLSSQGIQTGNLSQLGGQFAQMRYSKAFEQEADHVGLYIAKRAGYDLDSMPEMWRKMSVNNSKSIYTASTHPTYPERYVAMQQTISEIRRKEQNGEALVPTFQEKKRYF